MAPKSVLVVSEKPGDAGGLVSLARPLGEVYVVAYSRSAEAVREIAEYGHTVYYTESSRPEALFELSREVYEETQPVLVIGPTTKNVRDALSRLAGIYDVPMATEVTSITLEGGWAVYSRGFLSDKAVMRARVPTPAIMLVLPGIGGKADKRGGGMAVKREARVRGVRVVEVREKELGGADIEGAEVIVGVGRGFRSREDLKLAFELADLLGGQVGCTRPIAADLKWLPEDRWIGISGKKPSPKLYLAVGISGSPQHMSGVMGAKLIVAINKDRSAPIFQQSDYGVVADLYEFLPILIRKVKERRGPRA